MARRLHGLYKFPVHHLDLYFWQPGWEFPDPDRWLAKIREISSEDCWIIEGNYLSGLDILIPRADTIIFLRVSRLVAIYRIVRRTITHFKRERIDRPLGCQEKLDWEFLKYILRFEINRKPHIFDAIHQLGRHAELVTLTNSRDMKNFFQKMDRATS